MDSADPGQRDETGAGGGSAGDRKTTASRRPVLLAVALVVVLAVGGVLLVNRFSTTDEPDRTASAARESTSPASSAARPQALGRRAAAVPDRDSDRFDAWIGRIAKWLDIPERAVRSYANATVTLNERSPGCHMSWVTLAGIGKQATDHGAAGGGIGADGTPSHRIGNKPLHDFSGKVVSPPGARGPMQLSDSLWHRYGTSAAGHGAGDAQNLDDAALATGKALCAGGADLSEGRDWWRAVSRVDDAPLFLHRVLATATMYGAVAQRPRPPEPEPLHAVEFAISKIGLPYVWGGNGKHGTDHGGFDCSGLTAAAYGAQDVDLRRMADWQYRDAAKVPKGQQPRLGDLVFFGDPAKKIHHVGIYIGNHQMIDAPTFGQAVQVHDYTEPGDYVGAGRIKP